MATSPCGENDDPIIEAVTKELRVLLSEGKTSTAMRSVSMPAVDVLLKETGRSREDLPEALAAAVEAVEDPAYRAAAHDLFPLPYTDMGWLKLSVRGERAAGRFDIRYDAFRRGAGDRPSRMDDVVRVLAVSLTTLLEALPDPDAPQGDDEPEALAAAPAPDGRSRKLVTTVSLVAALVLAAVLLVRRDTSPRVEAPTDLRCSGSIGALDPGLGQEPGVGNLGARLRAVFDQTGGEGTAGCPTGPAYRWQKLVVQEMSRDGLPNGALVVSPNNVDAYLNRSAWGSYHQLGGKDGDAVQAVGGLIAHVVAFDDGHVEIELSSGTVLVAERLDAPYFWIPAPFVQWWRDHPDLGLPVSNPLPSARQEFRHGVGIVEPGRASDPMARFVDRPGDELPTLPSIRGRVLRQADATAWLIDDEGRRLWIPDGGTWDCLGANERRVGGDLPGYAIATLPYGGHARCPA